MKMYSMQDRNITVECNNALDYITKHLLKDGIIDSSQAFEISRYRVVLEEKGYFGSFWDKIFYKDDTKSKYVVVKVMEDIDEQK